jgi:hypothetical protein
MTQTSTKPGTKPSTQTQSQKPQEEKPVLDKDTLSPA